MGQFGLNTIKVANPAPVGCKSLEHSAT